MASAMISTPNVFPKKALGIVQSRKVNGKLRAKGGTSSLKRGKRLRPVSVKQAARLRMYASFRKVFLEVRPLCGFPYEELGRPTCGLNAVDIHHRSGRLGQNLLDTSTWLQLCRFHHEWVENHKNQARKMGLITYK